MVSTVELTEMPVPTTDQTIQQTGTLARRNVSTTFPGDNHFKYKVAFLALSGFLLIAGIVGMVIARQYGGHVIPLSTPTSSGNMERTVFESWHAGVLVTSIGAALIGFSGTIGGICMVSAHLASRNIQKTRLERIEKYQEAAGQPWPYQLNLNEAKDSHLEAEKELLFVYHNICNQNRDTLDDEDFTQLQTDLHNWIAAKECDFNAAVYQTYIKPHWIAEDHRILNAAPMEA